MHWKFAYSIANCLNMLRVCTSVLFITDRCCVAYSFNYILAIHLQHAFPFGSHKFMEVSDCLGFRDVYELQQKQHPLLALRLELCLEVAVTDTSLCPNTINGIYETLPLHNMIREENILSCYMYTAHHIHV